MPIRVTNGHEITCPVSSNAVALEVITTAIEISPSMTLNTYQSMPCNQFIKSAQSSAPENIGLERTLPGLLVPGPVLSPWRITLENNGKIRPQPDQEKAFAGASGGGDGPDVQPSPAKDGFKRRPTV